MNDTKIARLAPITKALQWDCGRGIWLIGLLLFLHLVLGMGDSITALLRYDRGAIAAGGWWRLLTAHVVHLDLHHLILNELGLVLIWSLFATDFNVVEWCVVVLLSALAISSGLWWGSPYVTWYVGASGVLHAVMAAGAARHWLMGQWDRWILLIGLAVKLIYERGFSQPTPMIVIDAHLYGVLAGFAIGVALTLRMAIIRERLV